MVMLIKNWVKREPVHRVVRFGLVFGQLHLTKEKCQRKSKLSIFWKAFLMMRWTWLKMKQSICCQTFPSAFFPSIVLMSLSWNRNIISSKFPLFYLRLPQKNSSGYSNFSLWHIFEPCCSNPSINVGDVSIRMSWMFSCIGRPCVALSFRFCFR